MEVSREVSVREVFEAKNLARVVSYIRKKSPEKELAEELILFLHKMLIGGISDTIAGRFREKGEYVRVGTYIAPPPEKINSLIASLLSEYTHVDTVYFLDKISKFHLEFENIHPFCDGNGRIGRVLISYQLFRLGFPSIILRENEKSAYYESFSAYREKKNPKPMEKVLSLALTESLHKRLTYLKGYSILPLSEYAKKYHKTAPSVFNAARRQQIPAFREKGMWKIGDAGEIY